MSSTNPVAPCCSAAHVSSPRKSCATRNSSSTWARKIFAPASRRRCSAPRSCGRQRSEAGSAATRVDEESPVSQRVTCEPITCCRCAALARNSAAVLGAVQHRIAGVSRRLGCCISPSARAHNFAASRRSMYRQAAMIGGESRDFHNSRSQQCFRAVDISAPVVMKCGGDLYDSLQKCLFRLVLHQPDFFPHLMRFEKLAAR